MIEWPSLQFMERFAAITAYREVRRILGHLGLATAFPRTLPARAPPLPYDGGAGEGCQFELRADDVRQDWPGGFGDSPA